MIAIIGAMPEEVEALVEKMENTETVDRGSRRFVRGTLAGRDVVITVSGVGKVNAASCTQQVIDLFEPEAVINTGVAGGLAEGLSLGDIVISEDAVQHDVDSTVFGYMPGQVPDMEVTAFPADEKLISAAVEAGQIAEREASFKGSVTRGRILSGDLFLTDEEKKAQLREVFHGACVEMEGAAIGQVAHVNMVPWVIVRCISDMADNPDVDAYYAFKMEAVRVSVIVVLSMMERMNG